MSEASSHPARPRIVVRILEGGFHQFFADSPVELLVVDETAAQVRVERCDDVLVDPAVVDVTVDAKRINRINDRALVEQAIRAVLGGEPPKPRRFGVIAGGRAD